MLSPRSRNSSFDRGLDVVKTVFKGPLTAAVRSRTDHGTLGSEGTKTVGHTAAASTCSASTTTAPASPPLTHQDAAAPVLSRPSSMRRQDTTPVFQYLPHVAGSSASSGTRASRSPPTSRQNSVSPSTSRLSSVSPSTNRKQRRNSVPVFSALPTNYEAAEEMAVEVAGSDVESPEPYANLSPEALAAGNDSKHNGQIWVAGNAQPADGWASGAQQRHPRLRLRKMGEMTKLSKGGWTDNWNRRSFALVGSTLYYSDSAKDLLKPGQPKVFAELAGCQVRSLENFESPREDVFALSWQGANGQVLLLANDSEDIKHDWMKAILRARTAPP